MRRMMKLGFIAALLVSQSALAVSYPLPPEGSRLVGASQVITVPHDNKLPLEAFAAQYGQGSVICWRRIRALIRFCLNPVHSW